jgi:hypothetical protein
MSESVQDPPGLIPWFVNEMFPLYLEGKKYLGHNGGPC